MKIRDMMFAALFTALVAVLGYMPSIPLPFGVPITLQTFGVMLAGAVLGARLGGLSLLVFILLAAVGAPVLNGGAGGLTKLLGPTGGYILSWPLAAYIIGYLAEKNWDKLNVWKLFIFNIIGGILVVYAIGIPYLVAVTEYKLVPALIGNLAFIPGDLIKAFVSAWIAIKLKKTYPIINK
ncbi:biotin biosynthesis protein BioY [Vulcanibacillus modesticaldus]|uniref:Biotin transporter n=1 Tax=Vulcanibacillus modesticaldus TaxID=337097 RepID=A0A1D2YWT8_9BACI|nr:biotin transporter BioY [Vulcanibacillus modesticaldus]OEG00132.1 biotin biosynthesis protein BioY [Vulcanibacillus modesticaldus]